MGQSKFYALVSLAIVPLLYFGYNLKLIEYRQPSYAAGKLDPEYIYLFSSLNVAEGHTSRHSDHPGTPLQIFGALMMRAHYATSYIFSGVAQHKSFRQYVFDESESILRATALGLAVVLSMTIYYLGLFVYGYMGLSSILLQLATLHYTPTLYHGARVNPEGIALLPTLLLVTVLIKNYEAPALSVKEMFKRCSWHGFVLGMGAALKLTFMPLWATVIVAPQWRGYLNNVTPLIAAQWLKNLERVAVYAVFIVTTLAIAMASFALWCAPIWGRRERAFLFIEQLAQTRTTDMLTDQSLMTGSVKIHFSKIIEQLQAMAAINSELLTRAQLLLILWLLCAGVLLWRIVRQRRRTGGSASSSASSSGASNGVSTAAFSAPFFGPRVFQAFLIITTVSVAYAISLYALRTRPNESYMIASATLVCVVSLYLVQSLGRSLLLPLLSSQYAVTILSVVVLMVIGTNVPARLRSVYGAHQQDWIRIEEILKTKAQLQAQYPQCYFSGTYTTTDHGYALSLGNAYVDGFYTKSLQEYYPRTIAYAGAGTPILGFGHFGSALSPFYKAYETRDLIQKGLCLIVITRDETVASQAKNATMKYLAQSGGEFYYRLLDLEP